MIDLNDLAYKMRSVAHARKMNGAKIDDDVMPMLKYCASEVVEATEAYDKMESFKENYDSEKGCTISAMSKFSKLEENFKAELADIIACVLIICANEPTIDIEKALQDCFEKNLARAELRGDKK